LTSPSGTLSYLPSTGLLKRLIEVLFKTSTVKNGQLIYKVAALMEQGPNSRYIPSVSLTGVQYSQTFQMAIMIQREQWFLRAYYSTNNHFSFSMRG